MRDSTLALAEHSNDISHFVSDGGDLSRPERCKENTMRIFSNNNAFSRVLVPPGLMKKAMALTLTSALAACSSTDGIVMEALDGGIEVTTAPEAGTGGTTPPEGGNDASLVADGGLAGQAGGAGQPPLVAGQGGSTTVPVIESAWPSTPPRSFEIRSVHGFLSSGPEGSECIIGDDTYKYEVTTKTLTWSYCEGDYNNSTVPFVRREGSRQFTPDEHWAYEQAEIDIFETPSEECQGTLGPDRTGQSNTLLSMETRTSGSKVAVAPARPLVFRVCLGLRTS